MNSKKTYIILGILLGIFTLVVLYLGFIYENDYFTIVADPAFKVTYDGSSWKRITKKLHILEKNFEVYDDNGYLGTYNVSHLTKANRWYIYDKKMNEISKVGSIFAFKTNLEYEYTDLIQQETTESDMKYIDKILKENKIDTNISYSFNYTYEFDSSEKDKLDKIIISNLFQDARNNNDAYSIVIAIIDGKPHTLYFSGKKNDVEYSVNHASLSAVFDVKKDGYRELLLTANSFGMSSSCVSLYEITKNGTDKKINC